MRANTLWLSCKKRPPIRGKLPKRGWEVVPLRVLGDLVPYLESPPARELCHGEHERIAEEADFHVIQRRADAIFADLGHAGLRQRRLIDKWRAFVEDDEL